MPQSLGEKVGQLTVFQRRPNWCAPLHNGPISPEEMAGIKASYDEIFERCDAILVPAALGPAPEGHASTGDSIFNGLWTLCGTPAVTVPLLQSETGLPMGVQLVGRRGDDARLLRTARWLEGLTGETEA